MTTMMEEEKPTRLVAAHGTYGRSRHLSTRPAWDDAFAFSRVRDAFIRLPYLFQKRIGLDRGPILLFSFRIRCFVLSTVLLILSLAGCHASSPLNGRFGQSKTG
jgi:hypothetical protein